MGLTTSEYVARITLAFVLGAAIGLERERQPRPAGLRTHTLVCIGAALFIILAGEYFGRTGDRAFLQELWSHVERALTWIDRYGDRDGDGFIEYAKQSQYGLVQQGWKDSNDSVFYSDGRLAKGPIALCEVQSYVYAAKKGIAAVARDLGNIRLAEQLDEQALEGQKEADDGQE